MDFSKLFPGAAGFIEGLPVNFPIIDTLQNAYAPFGALHLVGLAILGGCVILLNLRFLGAGLTDETPSSIERSTRPWLIIGVVIVLFTGIVIGILNASKLYYSPAFFAKMTALAASLIFTFGVTNSVARHEGEVTMGAKITAAIAFAVWLFSMGVFSLSTGVNPGTFHMITAAFAILLIFGARTRWIAVAAVLLLAIICGIWTYFFIGLDNDTLQFFLVTKIFVIIGAVVITGLIGFEIFTGSAQPASPLARLIALFSILSWVTVAAGGRWIGFS